MAFNTYIEQASLLNWSSLFPILPDPDGPVEFSELELLLMLLLPAIDLGPDAEPGLIAIFFQIPTAQARDFIIPNAQAREVQE